MHHNAMEKQGGDLLLLSGIVICQGADNPHRIGLCKHLREIYGISFLTVAFPP